MAAFWWYFFFNDLNVIKSLGIYDFSHYGGVKFFRTISSHFQRHGYETSTAGKIFHWESSRYSSSSQYWGSPDWESVQNREHYFQNSSVTPDDVNPEDQFFRDSLIVSAAVTFLTAMQQKPQHPWMLNVGLKGTHMPYHMPRNFWEMYKSLNFTIDEAALTFPPTAPLLHHVRKTESTTITYMKQDGRVSGREKEFYQVCSWSQLLS